MFVDRKARLEAVGVLCDERVRRVEDALRRAAVLDEGDDLRLRIRLAEGGEVAERRAAPPEDRLVVVADDGDVPMRRDKLPQQRELCGARVLELLDEHVAESVLQATRGGRVPAQGQGDVRQMV